MSSCGRRAREIKVLCDVFDRIERRSRLVTPEEVEGEALLYESLRWRGLLGEAIAEGALLLDLDRPLDLFILVRTRSTMAAQDQSR